MAPPSFLVGIDRRFRPLVSRLAHLKAPVEELAHPNRIELLFGPLVEILGDEGQVEVQAVSCCERVDPEEVAEGFFNFAESSRKYSMSPAVIRRMEKLADAGNADIRKLVGYNLDEFGYRKISSIKSGSDFIKGGLR